MGIAATINAAIELAAEGAQARQDGTVVNVVGNRPLGQLVKPERPGTHILGVTPRGQHE
jgi:hypothetical protein